MAQSGAGPPRRRPGSPIASVARLRRQDHHPRRRSFQVIRVLPLGWDLDPALGPARAFLNDRDIEHLLDGKTLVRSEEHTSELQSLMRISYAVFCLKNKKQKTHYN